MGGVNNLEVGLDAHNEYFLKSKKFKGHRLLIYRFI